MCSASPDCNVTTAHRCTSRNRADWNRPQTRPRMRCPEMRAAPLAGAPLRKPRQAWLPSVHLLCQPARPLPVLPGMTRLPRLVARGYPAFGGFYGWTGGPRRYSALFADSVRCWGRDGCRGRRRYAGNGAELPSGRNLSQNPSSGAPGYVVIVLGYAATSTCCGFTTSRRETDTGGRIRGHFAAILNRTESASPPRAEPCARAPLSPPAAPASYSGAAFCCHSPEGAEGRASARVG